MNLTVQVHTYTHTRARTLYLWYEIPVYLSALERNRRPSMPILVDTPARRRCAPDAGNHFLCGIAAI